MFVSLEELKSVLHIDPDDTTSDVQLNRIGSSSSIWIEGFTKRRFGLPVQRVEYHEGSNEPSIFLFGHIDDLASAENPSELADPATSLVVSSRAFPRANEPWQDLVEGTDWERRGDEILALGTWSVWLCTMEYRFTYLDGFAIAPDDIKQVLFELVINQRAVEANVIAGTAGITSESLGDYRYNVAFDQIGTGGNSKISDISMATLNGYRKLLVG